MSPRNLTILFISTVAVSLVLLILLFSLVFKNVDLSFDTKMPDAAPDLGSFYKDGHPSQTKGDGVGGANVNVPENQQPAITTPAKPSSGVGDEDLSKLQDEEEAMPAEKDADAVPTPPSTETSSSAKDTDLDKKPATVDAAKTPAPKPAAPKPAAKPAPMRIDPESAPTPAQNPAPAQ